MNYNLLSNFLKNKNSEHFEQMLELKEKIVQIEKEIIKMKENEIKKFRFKYEYLKTGNAKELIHYDLMHAAMFGNLVVL